MTQLLPPCGYAQCEIHQFGDKQEEKYKSRPLLCRLALHLHSMSIEHGYKRQCVRCGTTWRWYSGI